MFSRKETILNIMNRKEQAPLPEQQGLMGFLDDSRDLSL